MKKYLLIILLSFILVFAGNSQTPTSSGTDFWIAFNPNGNGVTNLTIYISSSFFTGGSVTSAYPGVDQTFTVSPGIVTALSIPTGVSLQSGIENKGIRITSYDPITVYGLNYISGTADAFLALPVNALGTDYRVISYSYLSGNGSRFSVVATMDNTVLTIFNHWTNSTNTVNLDQGQAYMDDETPASYVDITGSRIQSNHPVAVFGSHDDVLVPSGCYAGNHIVEEMLPYSSWGKNFATVNLAGRDNSGDVFRVVAANNGTEISINGTLVSTINAGDFYETNLTGYNSIVTSKPALLAQYAKGEMCTGMITGDPMMMLIPPTEQFITDYTIVSPIGYYSHWVNVVAPDYALGTIYQDGLLIPNAVFTQIGTSNYYGAQRSILEGSHTFTSTYPFGVFVYGWIIANSYGYPGGCSLSPLATVDSITLVPDTSYGQLNVTNVCLTANVVDSLGTPVAGVLVTFHVSGINPLTGLGYTDALGNAQYCYTQTGTTPGTDHIYAGISGYISDTVVAIWYLTTCVNPANGGTIGYDQSGCGNFTPNNITNLTFPNGQTGILEYKWQVSTTGPLTGFSDIPGTNTAGYAPGTITQSTWYRRLARVDCMTDWSGAVTSNTLEMTVVTPVIPAVTIVADQFQVCEGDTVHFTATPANGGANPTYQWKVNSTNAGMNSILYAYLPTNGDVVTCALTSSDTCTSDNPATSNAITLTVHPMLPVSVSINASQDPYCQGAAVNFTATPTNGGTMPSYQWLVNGTGGWPSALTMSYSPANGDLVSCVMNSNIACPTGNPATSNTITMAENTVNPVSIVISTPVSTVCSGTSVTFTATPTNGGTAPSYQWKVNGMGVSQYAPTMSYTPVNGDCISCILTSNLVCASGNPATSNSICMTVNPNLPVSLAISASNVTVCSGTTVTFSATPTNGGTAPGYQWFINGVGVPQYAPTMSYTPANGDLVSCILTSNIACPSGNPATSNIITMNVASSPVVQFTRCNDSITTINAQPFRLKGGIPLGGTYSGPGITNGKFYPAIAGVGTHQITYTYTNVALCSANAFVTIVTRNALPITCGNPLTDIRDNKSYPTVQIGSQCWLASNLAYGTEIPETQNQRDNCIAEKYSRYASPVTRYDFYQWDELMQYDETMSTQGFCPPGWHVPSELDWNTLFATYISSAFAAWPLLYTGYSGFNALLSGTRHMNKTWDWNGFTTFFWSSTSHGETKAWSHGMNDTDPSVSRYPAFRSNAFSVRCIRDN
ncbi:MAG: hypothetical protein NTX61_17695 [Bacteroidetes bacterium]|nr:hypothetical protein [Bacteroidota bacterium]